MITFMMIAVICSPKSAGFWESYNTCASTSVVKIEHIVTEEECNRIASTYKSAERDPYYDNQPKNIVNCVKVVEKN